MTNIAPLIKTIRARRPKKVTSQPFSQAVQPSPTQPITARSQPGHRIDAASRCFTAAPLIALPAHVGSEGIDSDVWCPSVDFTSLPASQLTRAE